PRLHDDQSSALLPKLITRFETFVSSLAITPWSRSPALCRTIRTTTHIVLSVLRPVLRPDTMGNRENLTARLAAEVKDRLTS
ncbi:hypothetical protein, partial [Paraburkholderia sp. BR10954]|uniref:hypothetical protein n=1 Tax=Paraburkholderia sp. BR10954 TaxID=3236995 RepID=UPI0034D2731F